MAADETKDTNKEVMAKLKELEVSLAKELDQKIRLTEPSDPRLEGTVDVNPNMAQAVQKAKDQAQAISLEEKKVTELAATEAARAAKLAATASAAASASAAAAAANASTQGAKPGAPDTAVNQGRDVDTMTLGDVDDLLNHLDEGFQASLAEIKSEIGKIEAIPNLESISIGSDYLKEAETKDQTPIAEPRAIVVDDVKDWSKNASLSEVTTKLLTASAVLPFQITSMLIKELKTLKFQPPKEVLLGILPIIARHGRHWLEVATAFIHKLTSYSRRVYTYVFMVLLLCGVILFIARDVIFNFRDDKQKDPFLRNFIGVADSMQVIPDEDEGEDLESPLRHPEYTVLVHRLVANLKAPTRHDAPMITMELYIEASSQETAIEIHNRELEVRDIIERVLEQMTFDDVDSRPGKNRLKVRIRNGLNRVLNKGTVRHIYFKNLNFTD